MESVIWTQESITYPQTDGSNSCKYVYSHPSQAVEANAYVSVIRAIVKGRQKHFVDTDSLLLSWEVWSPLLHQIELLSHFLDLNRTLLICLMDWILSSVVQACYQEVVFPLLVILNQEDDFWWAG